MQFVADILLVAGALGAGIYCFLIARRLAQFNDLESGVGQAVALLSMQVDDLTSTLSEVRDAASSTAESISGLTDRAELAAKRLELLLASMHDLTEDAEEPRESQSDTSEPVFLRHANGKD
ncbi:hypothetical protein [Aquicoccus porphyridii]|uniref:Uncharacterized protein n=1 Tax=Aquicoccus porphyridii TaxID=1852029 RepID=A0A5A9ZGN9_9RHOB|nr:hypothetical protein [Aquicoccus porphyridii]KAA0916135.1 hypothetical protein FLO80_10430 [Aquicoccus porphyridii]RAI52774.1 hypothetical protein DOO74_16640 [Rhodobacteraceae bacterium AsT-22]